MSANNYLYLTKVKGGYELSERNADSNRTYVTRYFSGRNALRKALEEARDSLFSVEYGLQIGEL